MEQINIIANGLVALGALGLLYFAPSGVAATREHHNRAAIYMLNLFLGWTFIGWVLALVWACTAVRKPVGEGRQA